MARKGIGQAVLLWSVMAVVVAVVLTTIIGTNVVLRSIEKNLPNTLLTELNGLTNVLHEVAGIVILTEAASLEPSKQRFQKLQDAVEAAYASIAEFRESYVADNLIKASAFHAVVAPAIADLRLWLREGIPGHPADSSITASVMYARIGEAHRKADQVLAASQTQARTILNVQRERIERFLVRVNFLFLLLTVLAGALVALSVRQYRLSQTESDVKDALRLQSDLLNSLFDSLELGIVISAPDGKVLHVNKGFTSLTGYSGEEIKTLRSWFERAFPDAENREEVLEQWRRICQNDNSVGEFKVCCSDGAIKDFEFRPTFLSDHRAVVTMIDITARKRDEAASREKQEVRDRSRKMESLGLLAGGVAHDLNNILSGIVSYPELLLMDIDPESRTGKRIQVIQKAGEKAAAIVQDLLTLARRGVATTEVLDLERIVSDYMETPEFRNLLERHPTVLIETEFRAINANILGSSVHLSKTVMNLIVNAAEAIEGSGIINITLENRQISAPFEHIERVEPGSYVILRVTDTGGGIAAKDLKHIFEPFYTTKVMGKSGSGLGMAVVWGTVKDHGGYIDVQSSPGSGCRVELYLPITDLQPSRKQGKLPVEQYMGSERILVVDDVKEQREIASDILGRLGYSVQTVASGEEAVRWLQTHSADLVLLDMIMDPGMDGLSTYRAILELHPGQKAILASGFSETAQVFEAQKLGAGAYIKKPYSLEKIGVAIRLELDGMGGGP